MSTKIEVPIRNISTNDIENSYIDEKIIDLNEKLLYIFTKRIIDIVGGVFGVILLIPIITIIYILKIFHKDKGSIFFTQERMGKNGKIFKMYKFRSMVIDADEKLEEYLAQNKEAEEEYRIYKKLREDPRITKVGNFLRRTSLDEFPQFINVLKGDMSIVGPRPYLPREKNEMGEYYEYIVKSKPGITGFWQVAGRSDVTFKDRLSMDMDYCRNANLITDTKLVFKTIHKVIKKDGAC